MRYYYQKPSEYVRREGVVYDCDHPLYNRCTLFLGSADDSGKTAGLAVVQKRFDPKTKRWWWDCLDSYLSHDIYHHPDFFEVLHEHAWWPDENGLYPTLTIRQLMWELRMKPLPKEEWEKDPCSKVKDILFGPDDDSPFE